MSSIIVIEKVTKNLLKDNIKQLKRLHRKIFLEKLYLYDGEDLIYMCGIAGSNKLIGICQITYKSPEIYFDDENKVCITEAPEVCITEAPEVPSLAYLMDFGIIPVYRRQGVGTLFLNYIKQSLHLKTMIT